VQSRGGGRERDEETDLVEEERKVSKKGWSLVALKGRFGRRRKN